ncbi:hypothetical protein MTP99_018434 [Tenebrio molitor]|nr:hypothetical protein MTP99_018434 [Tenebrio molitor]
MNDDNETEWQIFLKSSIEIISMIAGHAPLETLNMTLNPWKTCYDIYRRIESIVDRQNSRLSPLFFDHENEEITNVSSPMINHLIEKLLESASLATSIRFLQLNSK